MDFNFFHRLLLEMPRAIMPTRDFRDDDSRIEELKTMFPNGIETELDPIDTISIHNIKVNVYNISYGKNTYEFVFTRMDNDKVIAVFSGQKLDDGGIEEEYLETARGEYKGSIMGIIYRKFLLNKFKYILGDSMLSGKGLMFWKRNFNNWKTHGLVVGVYNVFDNTSYKLTNSDELDQYMGPTDSAGNYRFTLRRK